MSTQKVPGVRISLSPPLFPSPIARHHRRSPPRWPMNAATARSHPQALPPAPCPSPIGHPKNEWFPLRPPVKCVSQIGISIILEPKKRAGALIELSISQARLLRVCVSMRWRPGRGRQICRGRTTFASYACVTSRKRVIWKGGRLWQSQ